MYAPLKKENAGTPREKITSPVSTYKPDEKTIELTKMVLSDFQAGTITQTKSRKEFNDRSILEEININQQAFNSYVPPRSDDPDESWRAQTIRPVTRNKLISIAAHVTAAIIYPNVFAQNDRDEEDREAAQVMKDLVEWVIDNSNYSRAFIQAIISALVEPAVIMEASYAEVFRTIKEKSKEKGKDGKYTYTRKQIIDEILSGFKAYVIPCQELLIANIYEPDIQKQRFLIKSKWIDYKESKQKYGTHENFASVKVNQMSVFDERTKMFYDVSIDETSQGYLVHEVTYYNRTEDLEVVFINGICVTDPESCLRRKDKKYPFAKSGYEPLNNGQFFYFKSAANKLGSDQELVDTLYNMILDGAFLALMPPMALYGSEEVNSSVMIPGVITSFRDPNTKLESLSPRSDLRAGLETISMVERSMAESSQDSLQAGVGGGGSRTAREVMLLEKNAQVALGLFGKMTAFLVQDYGGLITGDILQHMTVVQVDELTNTNKYRSFLLHDKSVDGQKVTKKIEFTDKYLGEETMDEEKLEQAEWDLLEREGGLQSKQRISLVNPDVFRQIKYSIKVSADDLVPKSEALKRALELEAYDRLIQNPVVDQEAVTRDFLINAFRPGESDKYIKKQDMAPMGPELEGDPAALEEKPNLLKGVNSNLTTQITGSNSLGVAMSNPQ